eukprot:TRINITY_DN75539_c0_g1_i1.p1 TRINITY_DN75539_c0_g1~~TRINITY_DN75539_c0_g1_i1.p1  ORF type:complete len:395 (+),score=65.22 TRINITY_DN75539_c0_g1_i1:183-1367(+)
MWRSGAIVASRRALPRKVDVVRRGFGAVTPASPLSQELSPLSAPDPADAGVPGRTPAGLPADGRTLADFLPSAVPGDVALGGGSGSLSGNVLKKPPWLKMYNPNLTVDGAERYKNVRATVKKSGLATVCQEARCPNIGECWSTGTGTVMIMGDTCTRGCRFCSVATSRSPPPLDIEEPRKVAEAVKSWNLDYIVLTMVDRDDLADQGAAHVVKTVQELKQLPGLRVETLIGDFQGRLELVEQVVNAGMEVFAHNVETVNRLQRTVRDRRAGYQQSMDVLRHAKQVRPAVVTKSSVMLGLGEQPEEVHQVMLDLRDVGVEFITFGQYLQPTKRHMKVSRYVTPEEFDKWREVGESLGLYVASGPMVRSSYRAGEFFDKRFAQRAAEAAGAAVVTA